MAFGTEKFSFVKPNEFNLLPQATGVYAFKSKKAILYIGKAINIKERIKNHIYQPVFKDNIFVPQTNKIGFIATGSEIEALILEAELIKKFQPKYNTQWKDNKNYYFVAITNETFPRVFLTHQLLTINYKLLTSIGPFVDGKALKQTLRVLRRVFPFRTCRTLPKKPCLYKELNLCLAPCQNQELRISVRADGPIRGGAPTGHIASPSHAGKNYEKNYKQTNCYKSVRSDKIVTKKLYNQNIKNLMKILQGKKTQVLKNLQKEMHHASQKQDFEKARQIRDQIFALENVLSHSHIFKQLEANRPQGSVISDWEKTEKALQKLLGVKNKIKRIEGYDVSNIQGQQATGSMVVFKNGQPNKNEYRKFKIKIAGRPNDTAMLQEIINRRLKHKEWQVPQVILIDGGKAQLNAALQLKVQSAKFKVIALAKRKNELFWENRQKPILLKNLPQETANLILHIRDEAHRFAITYHKKLRSKNFIKQRR